MSKTPPHSPPTLPPCRRRLTRFLRPQSIAIFGGKSAEKTLRETMKMNFSGRIYMLNPNRDTINGHACYRHISDLPEAPDAAFLGVNRHLSVELIKELNDFGVGGAVCLASGFAEMQDDEGAIFAEKLKNNAGDMPYLGPNCYGMINYLDGAILWPDQNAGKRRKSGVAILAQSGNIALNFTFTMRGLRLAYVMSLGNQDSMDAAFLINALLDDDRITAIGLHLEGVKNIHAFQHACLNALKKGVPIVILKTGASEKGAKITQSHTNAITGDDKVFRAIAEKFGLMVVDNISTFLETLKLMDMIGAIDNNYITSMSCSGGEAALIADMADKMGLNFLPLSDGHKRALKNTLSPLVTISNPLDYHTFIWGDVEKLTATFIAMLAPHAPPHDHEQAGLNFLILDFPPQHKCSLDDWHPAIDAIIAARIKTGANIAIISTICETVDEALIEKLQHYQIICFFGMYEALQALKFSHFLYQRQQMAKAGHINIYHYAKCENKNKKGAISPTCPPPSPSIRLLDEYDGKKFISQYVGLATPPCWFFKNARELDELLKKPDLPYPLVLKICDTKIAHKSDIGGVKLNLNNGDEVKAALDEMMKNLAHAPAGFLLEGMIENGICEIMIGIINDENLLPAIVVASGGIFVEIMNDAQILPPPCNEQDIMAALKKLTIFPLLQGYRGQEKGDIQAVIGNIMGLSNYLSNASPHHSPAIHEMDINPLIVQKDGKGAHISDILLYIKE